MAHLGDYGDYDLHAVNEVVFAQPQIVPNPATILTYIPGDVKWFSVIHLANAICSVPVAKDSQDWFAFTYKGINYIWTRCFFTDNLFCCIA